MTFKPNAVVVGAGYVGLTLALHMASKGVSVLAIDTDKKKVDELQKGETPIFETGIKETLKKCVESGTLKFATSTTEGAPFWILAISYFPGDIQHYLRVLDVIKGRNNEPPSITIRGTVPVGYIRAYLLPKLEKQFNGKLDEAFYLASAPERSLSGAALDELANLPQLVAGSDKSVEKVSEHFAKSGISCVSLPKLEAGELAKCFSNFARLVQFNLANYLGALCHQYDTSEETMVEAIRLGYPRLNFLNVPGPGVGGFCLPKDSLVLYDGMKELEKTTHVIPSVKDFPFQANQLNEGIIQFHAERVEEMTKNMGQILAMGVAFKGKPRTDDTRDSVGIKIVRCLMDKGRKVEVYDRTVGEINLRNLELPIASKPIDLQKYQAVLLLNNDPEYKNELISMFPEKFGGAVALYDPWRLLVTGKESIFQSAFPWQSLKMHCS